MSERTHLLVQQWLQQALPNDGFTESLQNLSRSFPYFSAAHLLLLKKSNAEDLATRKKEASLHVYNPLFLEDKGDEKMFDFPFGEEDTIIEEPALNREKEVVYPTVEPNKEEELALVSQPLILEETNQQNTYTSEQEAEHEQGEPEIKMPVLNLDAPANNSSGITFEPYHTVDYFASQGIKLSQTEASNDQFGKQLKSFTEWLKTMKKLPSTAITHNTDGAGERKVENLAAHSVQNTDIITESMAEVWIKQGNIQKASEVYNKLSLQNPSKKAYFAAKIESLKKPS